MQDQIVELILRAVQWEIFYGQMEDITTKNQRFLISAVFFSFNFVLLTTARYLECHCVLQRSVTFLLLMIYVIIRERNAPETKNKTEITSISNLRESQYRTVEYNHEQIQIYSSFRHENHQERREVKIFQGIKHTRQESALKEQFSIPHLFERISLGIIVFDFNRQIVYQNEVLRKMQDDKLLPPEVLDIVITKIDKQSQKTLKKFGFKEIIMEMRSNPTNQSVSIFEGIRSISPGMRVKTKLSSIIHELFLFPSKEIFEVQPIECFEFRPNSYGLSMKISTFQDFKARWLCQIQFQETSNRDHYIQRTNSYQIMRQLFLSFSHEFGTSLNYIQALAQVAEQDTKIAHDLQDNYFSPIRRAGYMMSLKVGDMLDYNKILGKEFNLNIAQLKLQDILEQTESMFQHTMRHKKLNLKIQFKVSNFSQEFSSDGQRIQQVICNLVSNAQKFTQIGSVSITMKDSTIKGVEYTKISVEDTGQGMDENEQYRLRQLLSQGIKGCDKVSEHSVGFSLGLQVSNHLALQLSKLPKSEGGGLNFTSYKGSGSRFWFYVKNLNFQISKDASLSQMPIIQIDRKQIYDLRTSKIHLTQIKPKSIRTPMNKNIIQEDDLNLSDKNFDFGRVKSIRSNRSFSGFKFERKNSDHSIRQEIDHHEQSTKQNYLLYPNKTKPSGFRDTLRNLPDSSSQTKRQSSVPSKKPSFFFQHRFQEQEIVLQCDLELCKCKRVLVVDDEPINIFAITLLLNKMDLESESATNGHEAVKMIKERTSSECKCGSQNYSLVLMDLNMPVLDGFKATEAIRKMEIKQPVICAVTAFVDLKSKQDSYSSGMDYLINKPVSFKELQQVIEYFNII